MRIGVHAGHWLKGALLALALAQLSIAAEDGKGKGGEASGPAIEKSHPERLPERPTVAPAFTIPVEPLGFSPPSPFYLGQRISHASLDFLDENHLLFTFRIPGLIHRQRHSGDENDDERHIKAVVLALPSGAVQTEAIWPLHDRFRYLWMLRDGHFLVRDRDELRVGDASLELKPFLRFPGQVLEVSMDPGRDILVTNSREPAGTRPESGGGPGTAAASGDVAPDSGAAAAPDIVLRVLRRDSGQVMAVSRVRSMVHLPINADGYLEMLPGKGAEWEVTLNRFGGGMTKVGEVDSTCTPAYDFISEREFLVTTCTRQELRTWTAMETDGRQLWEDVPASSPIWPVIVSGADGLRMARESLAVNRPVGVYSPISFEDVKGQVVEVFDAATGKIALAAAASPILDAGGNVAISPSGSQVAVLNAGAIQVFDLPLPAHLPAAAVEAQASKCGP